MSKPGFRINDVWAYVAVGPDDEEGVMGFMTADGTMMPMICADIDRRDQLYPLARQLAKQTGTVVKLIHLSVREDLETL